MITRVKSWTHDDSIPRLLGRKKVDWSMFEYGSTIPTEFVNYFTSANFGYELKPGEGKDVILVYQETEYHAQLRNVNQVSTGREIVQIRYHSKELKELLLDIFQSTYRFILSQKSISEEKQIIVPDERAEYIDFYSTDSPFRYEIEFSQNDNEQLKESNIWWVNQGSTLSEELEEGIIWAPLVGKNGRSQYHWDTMDEVKKGDIILHYANGSLQYVSKALGDCTRANKPSSLGRTAWQEEGRLVRM